MNKHRTALPSLLLIAALCGCGAAEPSVEAALAPAAAPTSPASSAPAPVSGADVDSQTSGSENVNHAPVLLGFVIEPFSEATIRHDLVAKPLAEDRDGDAIGFRYAWRVNGTPAPIDGDTLPRNAFRRGDWIELSLVASDGRATSEALVGKPFEVTNAAPVITSAPGGFDELGRLRYQVEVEDPDDEGSFRYQLLEGPDGMQISAETGLLTWQPTDLQAGVHSARIEVVDPNGGRARQAFDLERNPVSGGSPVPAAPAAD